MSQPVLVSVIDDDEDIRHALGVMFHGAGYAVECFASAEAFLEVADQRASAVIVSDLQMGGMSGLDLRRELRDRADETPVILITAFATDGIRARARRLGIRTLLEKPFDPPVLLREVEAVTR